MGEGFGALERVGVGEGFFGSVAFGLTEGFVGCRGVELGVGAFVDEGVANRVVACGALCPGTNTASTQYWLACHDLVGNVLVDP